MKIRTVVAYEHHFEEFLKELPLKVQNKIYKVIEAVETLERIPSNYLKHLQDGLYETRIQLGPNIWRVLCFFDGDKVVVLLTGFQKKTQKTPSSEQELN
jgi:phage-related protein